MVDVLELKATIPPLEFYRTELPGMPAPKRDHGWISGGLCPFHDDRHATNFRINADSGAFKCFACGVKGSDVIAFVQRRHAVAFPEAVRMLADAWGHRL
ncbi:MAG TPA: CHC2 zinc finger domain-containing protein [Candidatus Hydrogenedentes bacterium]|nr:CHC2 zinc finger domain-containing protein [Candidatus Hydrogenedentota bacterium]